MKVPRVMAYASQYGIQHPSTEFSTSAQSFSPIAGTAHPNDGNRLQSPTATAVQPSPQMIRAKAALRSAAQQRGVARRL